MSFGVRWSSGLVHQTFAFGLSLQYYMAMSVLHHGTGCYSSFWGWALTSNLFFSCLLCLQCHVSVTSNISQHSDTFEPSWVQTLLNFNVFYALSAFLRQGRSLACVRSRPSFLSIRTTIKEALCFILEPHNWHLHIGSWNRGSSQRSQGIWQSEQFSHREQVFFCFAHLLAASGIVKSQFYLRPGGRYES